MSFRTRLTLFFVLIVIVPMVALGVVVARLVTDSEQGKANARAGAFATSAMRVYERLAERGSRAASVLGSDRQLAAAIREGDPERASARARALAAQHGLVRVVITRGGGLGAPGLGGAGSGAAGNPDAARDASAAGGDTGGPGADRSGGAAAAGARPLVDLGPRTALAAGSATIRSRTNASQPLATIEASTIDALQYVALVRSPGVDIAVTRADRTLAATIPPHETRDLPVRGTVTRDGTNYAAAGFRAQDFGSIPNAITILADASGTANAVARDRRIAFALLGGFLLVALLGALAVSRLLQAQIGRFLAAARRIGSGDLSTRVPTEGDDEFAQLGSEFNRMTEELERRIGELDRERGRLRASIERVGETFASNLDRQALVQIGAETIAEAVEATAGRALLRAPDDRLHECARVGDAADPATTQALDEAERKARQTCAPAGVTSGTVEALAAPIPRARDDAPPHGFVSVARTDRPFTEEERALLGSLATQTGISLENVELHDQVTRQAVTDELTGLSNHRRFQEVMATEAAAARRFGRPLGLLMIDVDNFKRVNDTYGHQQGDVVLREVARVVRETSREIDEPARYGGEEMAVALPQTDLDGAHLFSERVRTAVEALAIPRLDGEGAIRVTVSCGVAASATDDKDALVAAADAALYVAKRSGKNRTVRAGEHAPVALEAE